MSTKPSYEIEVKWEAPSGTTYEIPVKVWISKDPNYGADADGNRGVSTWWIDDTELGCSEETLKSIISDPEDLSLFDIDFVSEEVDEEISAILEER